MCTKCSNAIGRKSKSSKMAKKRKATRRRRSRVNGLDTSGVQGMAIGALLGAIGAVVTKKVLEQVLPAEYAQHLNYAQIGTGLFLSMVTKNPMLMSAGLGAATVGGANVVGDLADGQAITGLGLLAPGKNYNPSLYPGMQNSPMGIAPL